MELTGKYDDKGVQFVRLTRTVQSGIGIGLGIALVGLIPAIIVGILAGIAG